METKEIKINIPEGYEIDKENSTFSCIKFKKKVKKVNTWKDIKYMQGSVIHGDSTIHDVSMCVRENVDKNIFFSEKYAKSALALAQISQLMIFYGGEITEEEWKNANSKYCIGIGVGIKELNLYHTVHLRDLVAFHTAEQRDRFMSFPENIQLIKDLYMVD